MEKKKKTWTEPKLTALVRRKPEEGILQTCKGAGIGVGEASNNSLYDGCSYGNCNHECSGITST